VFTVSAYGPFLLAHALPIFGHGWRIAGVELFIFVPMLALVVAIVAMPFLLLRRTRPSAIDTLLVSGGLVILFIPTLFLATHARRYGFRLAARRAQPLVAALGAYQKDHGAAPQTLAELSPAYIAALPARLPPLELIAGDEARSRFDGNDWVLFSVVSTGLLNWDQFMYFPRQDYPDVGYGGWVERVDDWAYVHE
jgi:hypothetical protein